MSVAFAVDPTLPRRKLTVHEYHRMGETGILSQEDRVELIDGEIIQMTPIGDPHVDMTIVLTRRLTTALGSLADVSVQNPVRLNDFTEPEPDLAVLRTDRRRGLPFAADTLLIIEVADTSLKYDRDTKIPRYALAGIPEVWFQLVAMSSLPDVRIDLSSIFLP